MICNNNGKYKSCARKEGKRDRYPAVSQSKVKELKDMYNEKKKKVINNGSVPFHPVPVLQY